MTKVTQKQLIEQIKTLNEIKPNKEWAVLLKSQILAEKQVEEKVIVEPALRTFGIINILSSLLYNRKLAYAFAVSFLFIAGVFGFTELLPFEKVSQQPASLMGQATTKQNVADLNNKISDLAKATKTSGVAIKDINTKVSALAKSLKDTQIKDPQTLKEIAKTLADVPGSNSINNSDVKDLYQIIVQSQIADLEKTTLTEDQKKILLDAENLYNQGKYEQALEEILPINK